MHKYIYVVLTQDIQCLALNPHFLSELVWGICLLQHKARF